MKDKKRHTFKDFLKFYIFLIILGIIAIVIAVYFEMHSKSYPLLYLALVLAISTVGIIIYLDKYLYRGLNKKLINSIAQVLMAIFMFMAFFASYRAYQLSVDANKPHLTVQLTTMNMPWSDAPTYDFKDYFTEGEVNISSIKLPIYLKINNWGSVNTQIYRINFETKCGDNKGSLNLPKNKSTLIKPGDFFELKDYIIINPKNKNVVDVLPCSVDFWIYGANFNPIKKSITLKKH